MGRRRLLLRATTAPKTAQQQPRLPRPPHPPPRGGHMSDGSGRAYGDLSRFEPRLTDWLRCDQLPGPRRRMCAPLRITGDAAACNRVNAMITPIVDEYR